MPWACDTSLTRLVFMVRAARALSPDIRRGYNLAVAPHAGAWIETSRLTVSRRSAGRPSCGGVDRNSCDSMAASGDMGRPSCGGVDRNRLAHGARGRRCRRPSCGGVDRNGSRHRSELHSQRVAPHAGAWIETLDPKGSCAKAVVAPHAGAWIETSTCSPVNAAKTRAAASDHDRTRQTPRGAKSNARSSRNR